MNEKPKYLELQGKVSQRIISKLYPKVRFSKPNAEWFFADYSPADFNIGEEFDILDFEGKKRVTKIKYKTRLLAVMDQLKTSLEFVPKGYQTIVRLQFNPNIPTEMRNLKTLDSWTSNLASVIISKKEDWYKVVLERNEMLYRSALVKVFQDQLGQQKKSWFAEREIKKIIIPLLGKSYYRQFIDFLISSGKLENKGNKYSIYKTVQEKQKI